MKPTKTAEQFAREYAERSGVTEEFLRDAGRIVQPCDCFDEICEGWQMGYKHGGFVVFLSTSCARCQGAIEGTVGQTNHRAVCEECREEMERATQETSGGTLPVVIKTNYDETAYCGACGMELHKYRARFCHDCGEKVAKWSHRTHDIIEIEGWNFEEKVKMVGERWRGRLDLREYHPVRLKDAGWAAVSAPDGSETAKGD